MNYCYYMGDSELFFVKAHDNLQKALQVRQAYLPETHPDVIQTYHLLLVVCNYYEKLNLAQLYGSKEIMAMEKRPQADPGKLASLYLEMGKVKNKLGDLIGAIDYSKSAIRLFDQLDDARSLANCYTELGFAYESLKKYPEAFAAFQKTENFLGQLKEADDNLLSNCYNNIGLLCTKTQKYDRAIRYFEKAIKANEQLYQQTKDNYYRLKLAVNYENIGIGYKRKKQYDRALRFSRGSAAIFAEELGTLYHSLIAANQDNLGDIYFEQGQIEKAIAAYQKGIRSLVPNFKADDVSRNPVFSRQSSADKMKLLTLMSSKAKSLYELAGQKKNNDYLTTSLRTYLAVDTLITQIRLSYQAAGSRYHLIEEVVPVYENAIAVSIELYESSGEARYLDWAYFFCAKNKAIVLLEGMHDEYARHFSGISEERLEEERSLKKKVYKLESQLYEFQASTEKKMIPIYEDSLFQLKRQYEQMIRLFEIEHPAYFSLKYAFQTPLSISDIQDELAADQLFIEYFIGTQKSYVFTISKKTVRIKELNLPVSFKDDCRKMRTILDAEVDLSQTDFVEISSRIYQAVLKEPLAEFVNSNTIKRLLIIPDNALLQISFDALLTEKTLSWKGKENPYLLKKYATSYAYSNQLAFHEGKQKRLDQATERFMGFGLEYDDYTLEGLNGLKKENGDKLLKERSVGRLIYSDDEVIEIADLFDGKTWLNQAATKEIFLDNAPNSHILHLAMHGLLEEENPHNTALIFTRTSDSIDYLLKASDIYGLELNADLVALSACNSAYGNINTGEGIRSMARAFTYAGCPSLIASLWGASDISTKEIMLPFYENLKNGMPKDMALQKAKLAYIDQVNPAYNTPSFWSHLILIGDNRPLKLPSAAFSRLPLLGLAGLLVFCLGLFWRRGLKNSTLAAE